jgi:predicted NBD/HSP70 family sugar kinase
MTEKKKLYSNRILKELYFENSLSCADLSVRIEKSFPVTAKLLEQLIKDNLVAEAGFTASTGGRPAHAYNIQEHVMYLVSVAMDQFITKIAIMDMQNKMVLPPENIALPLFDNADALDILADSIIRIIKKSGLPKDKLIGIGIGMPGFVDVKNGVNYSHLQLPGNSSIKDYLSHKTGLPVLIDNDSSLIALAELRFGKTRGEKDVMVINIGWGIGLGLILEGKLYRGQEGFAGEFSHIPLYLNKKLCWCGKTDCLETETSLLLIIEKAREGIRAGRITRLQALPVNDPEMACEEFISAVQEGDQFAIELLSKAAYNLGKGVAILIHLLNPKKIILSGRGASAGLVWKAPIEQALNEHCIRRLHQSITIEVSTLGMQAELIGAAALVMENYETLPERKNEAVPA